MGSLDNNAPMVNEPIGGNFNNNNGKSFNDEEIVDDFDNEDNDEVDDMSNDGDIDTPKKEIQRLTGKLSQKLVDYNKEKGDDEEEVNKYVAGMIIPQTVKGMEYSDIEDLISKIESHINNEDDNLDMGDDDSDSEIENNDMQKDNTNSEDEIPNKKMESVDYSNLISEIINDLTNDDKKTKERYDKKAVNNKLKNKNPFLSNR